MLVLVAAHLVAALVIGVGARTLGRASYAVAAAAPLATLVWLATKWSTISGGGAVEESVSWVPGLDLIADARVDGFAMLMVLLVSGMGVLVLVYASSYFGSSLTGRRTAALLVAFAGSMLALVVADNLAWLYVAWEGTSVTSFLLIGANQRTEQQRLASRQALLVTGAGGLAMLGGFVILARAAGTWQLSELLADPPSGPQVTAGLGLVLAGAITKSAQYPFHFWLPGAMVAPTPVSAYLHSATMVKAGIVLTARFAPPFADVSIWRPAVLVLGLLTMVGGGLRALRQHDLKLLLAYGTVSQLGFLFVLAGAGTKEATKAATVLLLAHGLFKGALFLVVGIVDHETGGRDLRTLPRLGGGWGVVRAVAVVSAASMAGLPPLVGFVAKESAYEAFAHGGGVDTVVLAGLVTGSVLTFAYSFRLARPFLVGDRSGPSEQVHVHRPPATMVVPAALLGAATLGFGLVIDATIGEVIRPAAAALDPTVGTPHLKLWHGVNLALVLSAITIGLGALVASRADAVDRGLGRAAPPVAAQDGYAESLRLLDLGARRLVAVVQSGSLPIAIGVTLLTVLAAPVLAVTRWGTWPGWPELAEIPAHLALAAALAAGALGVVRTKRRFGAVLLLGSVGYAMAVLFAIQGAADLAITQLAVETLSVVVLVLVMRHLPQAFRRVRSRGETAVRIGVASAVGAGVFVLALMTTAVEPSRETSEQIIALSEPEGDGRNVVNVVLVDIRGLDTLGEISVLAVAGIGVVAVARVGRGPGVRTGRRERPGEGTRT